MKPMIQWPNDLEQLKEMKAITPLKKKDVIVTSVHDDKITKLSKRVDKLEDVVYNLRMLVEKQLFNIKKLNKTLNQERQDRAYGNLTRQKIVSK
jgi:hypothetical protein